MMDTPTPQYKSNEEIRQMALDGQALADNWISELSDFSAQSYQRADASSSYITAAEAADMLKPSPRVLTYVQRQNEADISNSVKTQNARKALLAHHTEKPLTEADRREKTMNVATKLLDLLVQGPPK